MNKYNVWYGGPTKLFNGFQDSVVEVEAHNEAMAIRIVEDEFCDKYDRVHRVSRIQDEQFNK